MTSVSFQEASEERQVQSVPLAQVSIEVGHLYREDLLAGPDRLAEYFRRLAPWVEATRRIVAAEVAPKRARVSTCLMVDDYSAELDRPAVVVPQLLRAVREAGIALDYLAREAACAEADGAPLARLVEERIVADPAPGTNGSRPPVTESGWLCNGQRSPAAAATAAMAPAAGWQPPAESAATAHSVFVDVELWDDRAEGRRWSCGYLAAVWQLLRLGLLRYRGAQVAVPQPPPADYGDQWRRLPAVIQLNERAAPFSAYRSWSILPRRFLVTEHAVRTILGQVAVEPEVLSQLAERSRAEGIALPVQPLDRIEYVFTG